MKALRTLGLLAFLCCSVGPLHAEWTFVRGDANGDGSVNIADAVNILNYLFSGDTSACLDAMDGNDDGSVNIADAVYVLDVLFGGMGTTFDPPFPGCGADPTVDSLDCVGPLSGCPDGTTSCTLNADCPTGEYCAKAVGDCNGSGECMEMPLLCPLVFDPVCGCDGNTYDNSCLAAAAGVNVDFAGACPVAGCTLNSECLGGEYCAKAVGDCNGIGTCMVMPFICPLIFDPVCGCDGNTYDNSCVAAASGVNVDFAGPCLVAGCTLNADCAAGEYCAKAVGDCNGVGTCMAMPFICPLIFDPVCGCDGSTYSNSCFAAGAGVNVDFAGMCP
ncbi:MAG: Kazal-type serine protease inhibitor domain-containing protein [Planctomycetota bacterium]